MTIFSNSNNVKTKVEKMNADDYKVQIRIDINMFNNIIGFILNMEQKCVTFKNIQQFYELFKRLDPLVFEMNDKLNLRYQFCYTLLYECVEVRHKLMCQRDVIMYIQENFQSPEYSEIINNMINYAKLNYDQLMFTAGAITDRLNFIHLDIYKQTIRSSLDNLDSGNFNNYRQINEELKIIMSGLLSKMRQTNSNTDNVRELCLSSDDFDPIIADLTRKIRDESRILKTGVKKLNEMLSPGYIGSNLYIYVGLPAAGKTTILSKSMMGIKKYNRGINTKKVGHRPTVLFITAEDTMEKIVGRMFGDTCPDLDIKDKRIPPEEVAKLLKQNGLGIENDDDIDLDIKYVDNKEIDTNDIYGIIEEVQGDQKEVICVIVDYIKRIRPALYAREEKDELKNVSNELRNIAINYDIPVITAAQFNREAAKAVDAAKMQNQKDASKNIGRGNIGSSFAMQENTDMMISIDTEEVEENHKMKKYMAFRKLKIRYRDEFNVQYFVQPYTEKGGNLMDDFDLPEGQYYGKEQLAEPKIGINIRESSNGLLGEPKDSVGGKENNNFFNMGNSMNQGIF